jgi:hypothetical protein
MGEACSGLTFPLRIARGSWPRAWTAKKVGDTVSRSPRGEGGGRRGRRQPGEGHGQPAASSAPKAAREEGKKKAYRRRRAAAPAPPRTRTRRTEEVWGDRRAREGIRLSQASRHARRGRDGAQGGRLEELAV